MLATTAALRREISRINRTIAQMEAKPKEEAVLWASTLRDLRRERERLDRLVTARRHEAVKKVVDFRLWREPAAAPTAN